ncbi:hypothetical protein TorRG33x02_000420 [Trema orientale]|uniref:Uncharacterized protein n=1 Tax=Trema orientale TaxID=63057 RepID=A0A2P5G103_TREOI|nr:hypothetical protein TorRG33x02_000420 [Trema orientale]
MVVELLLSVSDWFGQFHGLAYNVVGPGGPAFYCSRRDWAGPRPKSLLACLPTISKGEGSVLAYNKWICSIFAPTL